MMLGVLFVCVAHGDVQLVWEDGLNDSYVAADATLDLHQTSPPTALGEPPWLADTELNFAGALPPEWYAGFVHWHGYNAKHWGVERDITTKTEGAAAMRLAYASFGASTADITDIYLGRKFPTIPGKRYILRFDHRMDPMGELWPIGDDPLQREQGWTQYAVVHSGSLENMPGIEDYPQGEPGFIPGTHPGTRFIYYTDGQWHTYDYEFVATGTETSFVWDFRKNRVYPGDHVIQPGDGYHLDNVRLFLVTEAGPTNADFSEGQTDWSAWTVSGAPSVTADADGMNVSGADFTGGAYQRMPTGGAGRVVTVTGDWIGGADDVTAEVLVINADREPAAGVDETDGVNNAEVLYRQSGGGAWSGGMPWNSQLGSEPYRISFTANDDFATIVLRVSHSGAGSADVTFDDFDVRSVAAPASINTLPDGFSQRSMAFPVNHMVAMAQHPHPDNRAIYAIQNDGNQALYRIDIDDPTLTPVLVANVGALGLEFQSGAEGITFDNIGNMYISSHEGDIVKGTYNAAAQTFSWSTLVDLPESANGGWHGVNGLAVDELRQYLYICSGTLNNETQSNWWQYSAYEGRVLRYPLSGGNVTEHVFGIRNTFDIRFRADGKLFGVDNSPDPNINCDYADEVNLIEPGKHYGWPFKYGSDLSGSDGTSFGCISPDTPPAGPYGDALANLGPDGRPGQGEPGYQDGGIYYGVDPHSSPDGLSFYEPSRMDPQAIKFPSDYWGRAFVARFGSATTGHDVLSLGFVGEAGGAESGYLCNTFLTSSGVGSPIDVVAAHNGKVYVLDYSRSNAGWLYEISYTVPPDEPMIALSRSSIVKNVYVTDALFPETFTVSNSGTDTLNYTLSVSPPSALSWMTVAPTSGSSSGEEDAITLSYPGVADLLAGVYSATITVSSDEAFNSPQTLDLTVNVNTVGPDLDADGDVDLDDYARLQFCYTGPGVMPEPGCEDARLDGDVDVDAGDLTEFLSCLSGKNVLAERTCDGDVLETADVFRGGALYDKWWVIAGLPEPTTDHPLWATRPDMISNPSTGAATHRCQECHGWDYKGVDGQYGSGVHKTGFPGVFGSQLTATQMFKLLREEDTAYPNGHGFGQLGLSDEDLWDLVKFLQEGVIDTDLYVDGANVIQGNTTTGQTNYTNVCAFCHGADGTGFLPSGHDTLGEIGDNDPWKLIHKIRYGQPASPMPNAQSSGWNLNQVIDTGAYVQTLPPGQVP